MEKWDVHKLEQKVTKVEYQTTIINTSVYQNLYNIKLDNCWLHIETSLTGGKTNFNPFSTWYHKHTEQNNGVSNSETR